jgi:hypothetical protein
MDGIPIFDEPEEYDEDEMVLGLVSADGEN